MRKLVESSLGNPSKDSSVCCQNHIELVPLLTTGKKFPTKLIYPTDWFPYKVESQQAINEAYLSALEKTLGIRRTEVNLADEWKRTAPIALRNIPIDEYLKNVCQHIRYLLRFLLMVTVVWFLALVLRQLSQLRQVPPRLQG